MASTWMVSHGEYSDYGVYCVCATEAIANEVVAKLNSSTDRYSLYEVEEVALIENADEVAIVTYYFVSVNREGNIHHQHCYTRTDIKPDEATKLSNDYHPDQDPRKFPLTSAVTQACSTRGFAEAAHAARDRLYARLSVVGIDNDPED